MEVAASSRTSLMPCLLKGRGPACSHKKTNQDLASLKRRVLLPTERKHMPAVQICPYSAASNFFPFWPSELSYAIHSLCMSLSYLSFLCSRNVKEASSVLSCASSIVTSLVLQIATLQWFPIKTVMGVMQHAALSFLEHGYHNSVSVWWIPRDLLLWDAVGTGWCVCAVFSAAAHCRIPSL